MTETKQNEHNNDIDYSLQKIAKGTVFVFIGIILGIIFLFFSRVLVARSFTQTEYGIFSLCFTLISIAAVIGSMGLPSGAARQIAFLIIK